MSVPTHPVPAFALPLRPATTAADIDEMWLKTLVDTIKVKRLQPYPGLKDYRIPFANASRYISAMTDIADRDASKIEVTLNSLRTIPVFFNAYTADSLYPNLGKATDEAVAELCTYDGEKAAMYKDTGYLLAVSALKEWSELAESEKANWSLQTIPQAETTLLTERLATRTGARPIPSYMSKEQYEKPDEWKPCGGWHRY